MPPLTYDERYQIEVKVGLGFSNAAIAAALKRHPRTIERELARCGARASYTRARATAHRAKCGAASAANHPTHSASDWKLIESKVRQKHSPEQARQAVSLKISVSAIYRYLHRHRITRCLKELRHYRATGRRRGKMKWIKKAQMIAQRPVEVLTRDRIGHFEIDSIVGKRNEAHKIVVMLDRATRHVRLGLARHGKAVEVAYHMKRWAADARLPILSVTADQGYEFSALPAMLSGRLYACDAGKPYQKGAVENMNKLIRQYIPKGTTLRYITQERLDWIANELNERVRKRLSWQTPNALLLLMTTAPAS